MSDWYYARDGQQTGPVSADQLKQWLRAGQLSPQDHVWREGLPEWLAIAKVPELVGTVRRPMQAPAPTAARAAPQPRAAAQPQPATAAVAKPAENPAAAVPTGASLEYEGSGAGEPLIVSPAAISLLRQTKPWVKLFSVLLYIGVGLIVLASVATLIALFSAAASSSGSRGGRGEGLGVFLGVVQLVIMFGMAAMYYFPATFLGRYAARIDKVVQQGRRQDFEAALRAQMTFWKFIGIATLVLMGIYAVIFVLAFMAARN
jgi:hypothetical protein